MWTIDQSDKITSPMIMVCVQDFKLLFGVLTLKCRVLSTLSNPIICANFNIYNSIFFAL